MPKPTAQHPAVEGFEISASVKEPCAHMDEIEILGHELSESVPIVMIPSFAKGVWEFIGRSRWRGESDDGKRQDGQSGRETGGSRE